MNSTLIFDWHFRKQFIFCQRQHIDNISIDSLDFKVQFNFEIICRKISSKMKFLQNGLKTVFETHKTLLTGDETFRLKLNIGAILIILILTTVLAGECFQTFYVIWNVLWIVHLQIGSLHLFIIPPSFMYTMRITCRCYHKSFTILFTKFKYKKEITIKMFNSYFASIEMFPMYSNIVQLQLTSS